MADVFLSNLAPTTTYSLHKDLEVPCAQIGAYAHYVHVIHNRGKPPCAILTLPSQALANTFVESFGKLTKFTQPRITLSLKGRVVFVRHSNNPPRDPWIVKGLVDKQQQEWTYHMQPLHSRKITKSSPRDKDAIRFAVTGFECGAWAPDTLDDHNVIFNPRYTCFRPGTITFRPQSVVLDLEKPSSTDERYSLLMYYHSVFEIFTDCRRDIFFSLANSPRIYLNKRETLLDFGEKLTRDRIGGIEEAHEAFAGFSLVYKVSLLDSSDHGKVMRLGKTGGIPPICPQTIATAPASTDFITAFTVLVGELQDRRTYPYRCAFQLNKLVSNVIMPPECVLQLLPRIRTLISEVGPDVAAEILKEFVHQDFGTVGTDNAPQTASGNLLLSTFDGRVAVWKKIYTPAWFREQESGHTDMAYVHRVMITPTGVFSYGPKWEASNRVLREYSQYQDYFLRVIFCEEDGEQFMHEPRVNSERILQGQFLSRIDPARGGAIVIAGREFTFLGFSNSSLKTQTCWYMAPFRLPNGEIMTADRLINSLGDFSNIRTPGRFAARVGQAFSDTIGSALVKAEHEITIPDIKRYDESGTVRNFSDGIGKVSMAMVERIWKSSERVDAAKPTVFQIRFAGAKGVVALDTTLTGDKLCLRRSMIKFDGSEARNIEICSWAKRLPMFLNRPLIKVLEDREIAGRTFMDLQNDAVQRLHDASTSAYHAASHLRRRGVSSPSLKLPWLFESLHNLGLNFWDDPFLERTLELTLLMDLRDMKYHGRIPVPKGVTLMGVLDETKYLEEGQIFISTEDEDGDPEEILGRVMITRSPVVHPGDVQCVESVRVPATSPLRKLRNCVVFSQQGDRPLPSMLGGGDLDGDLYNVIYDERFLFDKNEIPADYPSVKPLELDRPIVASDVANFFIEFIENNLLGLISNRHLLIADQEKEGVYHPNCLKLAEMASTAVDFPKTGRKVERNQLPRASRAKPDFMAPGPRVLISKEKVLHDPQRERDDDEDTIAQTWYASDKILGRLYRDIKEEEFLEDVRHEAPTGPNSQSILKRLWTYFLAQTESINPDWPAQIESARGIREMYDEWLQSLMHSYSDTPWKGILNEEEVFVGSIMGREKQSKRQRERSGEMKEDFNNCVTYTIGQLRGDDRQLTLARSMAALNVYLTAQDNREERLHSFPWVVVSVLMTEVDILQKERRRAERTTMRVGARRGASAVRSK